MQTCITSPLRKGTNATVLRFSKHHWRWYKASAVAKLKCRVFALQTICDSNRELWGVRGFNMYPGCMFSVQVKNPAANICDMTSESLVFLLSVKTSSVMSCVPESGARVTFLCFYWNVTRIPDLRCNYFHSERPTLNVMGGFLTHSFIFLMMQRSRLRDNFRCNYKFKIITIFIWKYRSSGRMRHRQEERYKENVIVQ